MNRINVKEWNEEGQRRFGTPARNWKFVCPNCRTIQSGQDFLDMGISVEETQKYVGFSCIGRWNPHKGCDWTLGGLFQIHTLEVIDENGTAHPYFEFAPEEQGA